MTSSDAYEAGICAALMKLGALTPALKSTLQRAAGGAAAGSFAGYHLSPEDRKGYGVMLGGALGGAGAALGPHALELLHSSSADPKALTPAMRDGVGTLLGGAAGIGASQLVIDKRHPDSSEDPYRYTVR